MRRLILVLIAILFSLGNGFSQESYEDYRYDRNDKNRVSKYEGRSRYNVAKNEKKFYNNKRKKQRTIERDKPLSETKASDREKILDELRGAVRDEIDDTMDKEREAGKKNINKNKLVDDVRKIVREEIEDAIKVRDKLYLTPHTIEVGGFLSFQTRGFESDSADNNFRLKIMPLLNYFITNNVAFGLKGEADFNLTTGTQAYNIGIGPQYTFGIDRNDNICVYTGVYAGVSYNSTLSNSFGYRYGNEFGLKFILTSGVILNVGVLFTFDNAGDQVTGFQNIVVPAFGISAWF